MQRSGIKVLVPTSQVMAFLEAKGYDEATKYWKHPKEYFNNLTLQDIVGADLVLWYLNPGQKHWTLMVG